MDLPNNDQIMNKIGGGANPGAGNSKP